MSPAEREALATTLSKESGEGEDYHQSGVAFVGLIARDLVGLRGPRRRERVPTRVWPRGAHVRGRSCRRSVP